MKKLVLMVFIAVTAFASNQASAQLKTAFVSLDEVVQMMPEYKKAMGDLAQYDSALQINYAETVSELNRQDSILKTDSLKMSNAVKTAKRENLKKLFTELQGYEQTYQQQMQAKNEELLSPVAQKANALINEVAKTNGYNYVFRKEALLVYPEADDLLPLIRKKLGPTAVTPTAKPGTIPIKK